MKMFPDAFIEELENEIKEHETWFQDDILALIDRLCNKYSKKMKKKHNLRVCSACGGKTPEETLKVPDSCYCKNCGAYLGG